MEYSEMQFLESDIRTREALCTRQLARLAETAEWVFEKSPFYRERFQAAGFPSGVRLKTLADIERLPFTSPEDLRQRALEMVCVPQNEISRIVTLTTSGTTGRPKRIYFTETDQELTIRFFHLGMQNLVDHSDRVLILMPCRRPGSIGDLLRQGLERLGCGVIPCGVVEDCAYAKLAEELAAQEVTSIVGIPQQVGRLLAVSVESGASETIQKCLRTVLLSADFVPEELCVNLEAGWDCTVFEHYGMTEMGLGGAVSCRAEPNGRGYHVRELDLYVEIIDPKTGQVLPDGEEGEVVFTTLTRRGMPFIRYRTGDYSHWMTELCTCGSITKKLAKIGKRPQVKKLSENIE